MNRIRAITKKYEPSEDEIMIALYDWVKLKRYDSFIWHIANERRTSIGHGAKLKRMGVRPGVSDFCIARPCVVYAGMWLEVKAGKNKPTPLQIKFMEDMNREGYYAIWRTGFDACKLAIEQYLLI